MLPASSHALVLPLDWPGDDDEAPATKSDALRRHAARSRRPGVGPVGRRAEGPPGGWRP